MQKGFSVLFLVSFLWVSAVVSAKTFEDYMVFPEELVNDLTLSQYADLWWQWTYKMPPRRSPVVDTTGKYCAEGQQGNVWFLAGGYGDSTITRQCTIAQDQYIFFPVINTVYFPTKEGGIRCEQAKQWAALNNDDLLSIEVSLNGMYAANPTHVRLKSTDCFNILAMVPEKYEAPILYPSASDGYWMMLKPLPAGEYQLNFRAQYNRVGGAFGEMLQDIKYQLTVE